MDVTPIRPVRDIGGPPTDVPVRGLPVEMIRYFVSVAVDHARRTPHMRYQVQAKGWGHPARVIAPMFDYCPDNVMLPYEFMY